MLRGTHYYKELEDMIDGKVPFDPKSLEPDAVPGDEIWLTDGDVKMMGVVGPPDPTTGVSQLIMQRGTYQCCHE